ncbi:hypothetical protein [Acidovorax sp. 1608163]|uniref:hypothetical protein n=1 Tax=Acidovorax sp. 1608163 TaxID=2478662 RepID=UPI0013CF2CF5|nr:hypothetical protein [Acidovorax sp. 1608163]
MAMLLAALVGCGGGSGEGESAPSLIPVDPLKVDASYGTEGSAKLSGLAPSAVVLQPDGKLLLAGSRRTGSLPAVNYGGAPAREVIVRRLAANGAPDTSFGNNGEVSFTVKGSDAPTDIKLQKNGRIVIAVLAGEPCAINFLSSYAPCITAAGNSALRSSNLVALTAAGQLDRTFGKDGVAETASSQNTRQLSLAVSDDDSMRLLESWQYGVLARFYGRSLDRISANGIVDNSATQPTPQPPCEADGVSLLIQSSGSIISGGGQSSTYADPSVHPGLCIATHDPKSGLQTKGTWTKFNGNYALSSLASTSDDGFVAVGTNCGNGSCQLGMARYQANAERQTSYGKEGFAYLAVPQYSTIASTLVLSDDSVIVLANRAEYDANGSNPKFGAVWARMSPQGEPVKDFGTQGLLTTPFSTIRPTHLVPDSQGRWLVVSVAGQADDNNATVFVQRVAGHSKP